MKNELNTKRNSMASASPSNQVLSVVVPVDGPMYASATWEEENRMTDFTLDSTVPGKYKTTISNILSKHCAEVRSASDELTQPITSFSKKKMKELISKHNNEIFAFMN